MRSPASSDARKARPPPLDHRREGAVLATWTVVRLVEGVRDGTFSDAEWILITSLGEYFRNGMLPLKAGSSLRLFLATLLNRVPDALTKKFTAEEMELGKQTFEPQDVDLTKAARTFQLGW